MLYSNKCIRKLKNKVLGLGSPANVNIKLRLIEFELHVKYLKLES